MTSSPEPSIIAAMAELGRWSDALPEYDVAAGAVRHAERLRNAAPAAMPRAPSLLSRTAWWVAGGAAVVALGIAVAPGGAHRDDNAIADVSLPASTVPPPARALAAAPAAAVLAPTRASPDTIDSERAAPTRRAATTPRVSTASVAAAPDRLERELALVRRMRTAAPAQVLELARTADREVGKGVLGEERAALEVLALSEQGDPRARARAEAFLREHEGSPFAAKLERVVAPRTELTPPG